MEAMLARFRGELTLLGSRGDAECTNHEAAWPVDGFGQVIGNNLAGLDPIADSPECLIGPAYAIRALRLGAPRTLDHTSPQARQ
jgi:hypothetical protein